LLSACGPPIEFSCCSTLVLSDYADPFLKYVAADPPEWAADNQRSERQRAGLHNQHPERQLASSLASINAAKDGYAANVAAGAPSAVENQKHCFEHVACDSQTANRLLRPSVSLRDACGLQNHRPPNR